MRVDVELVHRFAAEFGARLADETIVRRTVRLADGLALALRTSSGRDAEIGIVTAAGGAWVWWLDAGARTALHAEIDAVHPTLAGTASLGWRDASATNLDALRAWLVRPAPGAGAWARLEGLHVVGMAARSGDRVLEIELERRDAIGRRQGARLVAELFDRGGNILLLDSGGEVTARTRERAPSKPRHGTGAVAAMSTAVHVVWSVERGVHTDAAAPPPGLGLAAAAHLALVPIAAAEVVRLEARRVRRDLVHLERLHAKQAREDEDAGAAERYRRDAELLAANLHRVRRGQARIEIEDWFADNARRTLELDPEKSPQDNVAQLFKRAKRSERGRDAIAARHADTQERLGAARAAQNALDALPERPDWDAAVRLGAATLQSAAPRAGATPLAVLWAPGGPERDAASPSRPAVRDPLPGRRFVLAGGWEVRVGRSNAENDVLTHRFAAPDDVWLHAGGVSGSHVVLRMHGKSDNPPRDVLEAAAAIAARFSKAKHAGTVPVVWTRKRYVRKPRGSPAGLAVCTHEKTVFVKPALPEGTDEEV
jgi:hypothetical protein